ncbi:uncharacterized protein NECHADRAFT_84076 [Fusarium vanettenii 77-13-4]|uniref:Uncharacterized protein n=1 Tax=Fusarium vanettenii (strain ATCC MYA-4622 / CBS 123669 / FGSC 9596 / NRRL 45880 / 77-13-4) TaxID=660122 RepID=C7YZM1_FUSV7|nr:uncharacterized protein NECHADRAFT_84076 [Fusarium vanettenii 77-13-4]EEU42630.1 predicted protein [Fusarium vanettenii 77-13-4]
MTSLWSNREYFQIFAQVVWGDTQNPCVDVDATSLFPLDCLGGQRRRGKGTAINPTAQQSPLLYRTENGPSDHPTFPSPIMLLVTLGTLRQAGSWSCKPPHAYRLTTNPVATLTATLTVTLTATLTATLTVTLTVALTAALTATVDATLGGSSIAQRPFLVGDRGSHLRK